jgi:hypothetical protein
MMKKTIQRLPTTRIIIRVEQHWNIVGILIVVDVIITTIGLHHHYQQPQPQPQSSSSTTKKQPPHHPLLQHPTMTVLVITRVDQDK